MFDIILYTWFVKKEKRWKKFWGWKICLVYSYFSKHLSLSMLISFAHIKKECSYAMESCKKPRFFSSLECFLFLTVNVNTRFFKEKGFMMSDSAEESWITFGQNNLLYKHDNNRTNPCWMFSLKWCKDSMPNLGRLVNCCKLFSVTSKYECNSRYV